MPIIIIIWNYSPWHDLYERNVSNFYVFYKGGYASKNDSEMFLPVKFSLLKIVFEGLPRMFGDFLNKPLLKVCSRFFLKDSLLIGTY